jgi:hypothetical protein
MLGDWFEAFGIGGDHNISKVVNGALSGATWILISAAVVDSKNRYLKYRRSLIEEQTRLLTVGDEWLSQVREERNKLAESLRLELAQEIESTRTTLHALMKESGNNWSNAIRDLALSSGETFQTLTASIKNSSRPKSDAKTAFATITTIPLIDGRWPAAIIALIGALPVVRLTSLPLGIGLIAYAWLILWTFPAIGKRLIHEKKLPGVQGYIATCGAIFFALLLTGPMMLVAGLDAFSAISFAILGGVLTVFSVISFSLISLNSVMRRQDLRAMQEQNAMLEIFEAASIQRENVARVDFASYLGSSTQNALKAATNAIEKAIEENNDEAVNSGLAVLDALASNILGRYTSEESIDFRKEIDEIAQPWNNQAIITWHLDIVGLEREISRRLLLVIAQCVSHLMTQDLAQRIHIDVSGSFSKARLSLESNANMAWLETNHLTRDVIEATAGTAWSITGTTNTSVLIVDID